jgi:hypothetical protein
MPIGYWNTNQPTTKKQFPTTKPETKKSGEIKYGRDSYGNPVGYYSPVQSINTKSLPATKPTGKPKP